MHKAELFIFDKKYSILDFELTLEKEADTTGLPVSNPYGGKMTIKFASSKNDTDILEAAMASRMMVKGYVRMYRRDGIQKLFDYEFANAFILLFNETFDANSKNPVTIKVIIAPGILKKEDWIFMNYWNPNNPFLTSATPITSSKDNEIIEKEKLTEVYYTDLSNKKIYKISNQREIFLVVKSTNMITKKINVDLSDTIHNFKYNEDFLKNDILENYTINSNHEKIKLGVKYISKEEQENYA